MDRKIFQFEKIARKVGRLSVGSVEFVTEELHPFDERNVHPQIGNVSKKLFDDGHFAQATFEAFKHVDNLVAKVSNENKSGYKLMMDVFNENTPKIQLTNLSNTSEKDEQKGYSFLFAGSMMAIRNPRGHDVGNSDSIEQCLDHLCLASLLLRRLDERQNP
ncbi:MAG: TIGR02391 family protein [Rhizobiaceae bacterium]|nr:TIGR02391 family protein [Rhizobiaceae bacterium]